MNQQPSYKYQQNPKMVKVRILDVSVHPLPLEACRPITDLCEAG